VAYNADIATATSMAPQLGTLSSTTTPTSTQGAVVWGLAFNEVRTAFLRSGMSDTVTSSSRAEELAQQAEMLLTSGMILLAKGSIGPQAQTTAEALIVKGREILSTFWDLRDVLLGNGATGSLQRVSDFAKSSWTQDSDPEFDYTPGTGDRPYFPPPVFEDPVPDGDL
jgi:hypothetical protein